MKKIGCFCVLLLGLYSCRNVKPYTLPESESLISTHKRVAILPFEVKFSEDYKKMMREGKTPWEEQERRAGIDLQRSAFEYLAKRANKKKLAITVQDYLTTNRTLEQSGIPYSQLMVMEKSRIASLLGVDAVIFGSSSMEFNVTRGFAGSNGIITSLDLFDASAGQKVWGISDREYIRNRFDSPQDLARRTVSDLIGALPYKKQI
ncbi:MAG: hypothetical protein KF870_15960 [Leadbetterella sp.]|nr:hypothetical protein [Leadbetterella sp.]